MIWPAAVEVGCWTKLRRLAAPGRLVRLKVAGDAALSVAAVTWKLPVCELAVSAGEVAMPELSVVTVAEPANDAPAPFAGTVKVTETPGTAFPSWSRTTARSGSPYAVFTAALWPPPSTGVIVRDSRRV